MSDDQQPPHRDAVLDHFMNLAVRLHQRSMAQASAHGLLHVVLHRLLSTSPDPMGVLRELSGEVGDLLNREEAEGAQQRAIVARTRPIIDETLSDVAALLADANRDGRA
jgi:hypothetical protein